jgi:hypothetical protein
MDTGMYIARIIPAISGIRRRKKGVLFQRLTNILQTMV